MSAKPVRYLVRAEDGSITSYNTALDVVSGTTAESQAKFTANRYGGELFMDFGDGNLIPYLSK